MKSSPTQVKCLLWIMFIAFAIYLCSRPTQNKPDFLTCCSAANNPKNSLKFTLVQQSSENIQVHIENSNENLNISTDIVISRQTDQRIITFFNDRYSLRVTDIKMDETFLILDSGTQLCLSFQECVVIL